MSRNQTEEMNDGGVFNLTQQGDGRINEMKKEIQELEQLLAGTNQVRSSFCVSWSIFDVVYVLFITCLLNYTDVWVLIA